MSDLPKIRLIKIKLRPEGEIVVTVTGGIPSQYEAIINLTPVSGSGEPNCTNNSVPATWNTSGESGYKKVGTFDGGLTPSAHGYNADVIFTLNDTPQTPSETGIPVSVIAPPAL